MCLASFHAAIHRRFGWLCFLIVIGPLLLRSSYGAVLSGDLLINEIHYHPPDGSTEAEYVEIWNATDQPISLQGWKLAKAVDFQFPPLLLPPNGYWAVCANPERFSLDHPDVALVAGPWSGRLSNSSETLQLVNDFGIVIDEVTYADDGNWGVRRRGLLDRGHRGWEWWSPADGGGKSLERRSRFHKVSSGQLWGAALSEGATPGRRNSIYQESQAPLILQTRHHPAIPLAGEEVIVTAKLFAVSHPIARAEIFYRVSSLEPDGFKSLLMNDDGVGHDQVERDGVYTGSIPDQSAGTVVEFYIRAEDNNGQVRYWPAPAEREDRTLAQAANCLLQFDTESASRADEVHYKFVLSEPERMELDEIWDHSPLSDALMNATFIRVRGNESRLCYLVGVRNRGHGSRVRKPHNLRVKLLASKPWEGQVGRNVNAQYTWLQVLGSMIFQRAGLPGSLSHPASVTINGANLSLLVNFDRTYGRYAINEIYDGQFTDRLPRLRIEWM